MDNKEVEVKNGAACGCESPKKMSYEELENIAHQLSNQSKDLYNKLQEANMINMFKRMDYLFKVIETSDKFPTSFVDTCIQEVQELMNISEDNQSEDIKPE